MAVTRDNASGAQNQSSPYSASFAIANQTGRILFLSIGAAGASALGTVTPTYNGVAMTLVNSTTFTGSRDHKVYKLLNPTVGANTLAVSWTGGGIAHITAWSGYGVADVDVFQNTTGTGTAVTANLTTVADNDWIVSFMVNDGTPSNTGGTNAVLQAQNGGFAVADSNGALTPAGSKTTAMTLGSSVNWSWTQVAINPPVAYTLTPDAAAFTLTGFAATLLYSIHYVLTAATGAFTLTGFNSTISNTSTWSRLAKNTSVFSNLSKSSSSWSNLSKNSSTFTNLPKS